MPKFKSLGAALLHYFKQEPNAFTPSASEIVAFKNSFSEDEKVAAKKELEGYGYEFEAA